MPAPSSPPPTNGNSGGVHYADMQMVFDRPALDSDTIKSPADSERYLQIHIEWKLLGDTLKELFGKGIFDGRFGEALQELAKLEMPEPLRNFLNDCSQVKDDTAGTGGKKLGIWSLMVRYENLVGTDSDDDHPVYPNYDHNVAFMYVDLRYRVPLFSNSTLKARWDDISGALRHDTDFTAAKGYIKTSIGYSGTDDAVCASQLVEDLQD